jgi:hypothetical protein
MAVRTKIERIDTDIALFMEDVSPATQSEALADFAEDQLARALEGNRSAIGAEPAFDTFVDGRRDAALTDVRPDGSIVFEFHILSDVVRWVDGLLIEFSPVRTGRYQRSHVLFVDGAAVDPQGAIPDGQEFVLMNLQPYAEDIENDLSKQAPDGVFQAAAALANEKFGQIATVEFGYRDAPANAPRGDNNRRPAVVIKGR